MWPLTAVAADPSGELPFDAHHTDSRKADSELGGDLLAGQPASVDQSLSETLQLGGEAYPLDANPVEGLACTSTQILLVEPVGHLCVGVFF